MAQVTINFPVSMSKDDNMICVSEDKCFRLIFDYMLFNYSSKYESAYYNTEFPWLPFLGRDWYRVLCPTAKLHVSKYKNRRTVKTFFNLAIEQSFDPRIDFQKAAEAQVDYYRGIDKAKEKADALKKKAIEKMEAKKIIDVTPSTGPYTKPSLSIERINQINNNCRAEVCYHCGNYKTFEWSVNTADRTIEYRCPECHKLITKETYHG